MWPGETCLLGTGCCCYSDSYSSCVSNLQERDAAAEVTVSLTVILVWTACSQWSLAWILFFVGLVP